MFGYITVNRDELKIKDYNLYRSFYCGLCRELKEAYGLPGQLSLSYDMTFLILLLTALYESDVRKGFCRCIAHPLEKHPASASVFTSYAADMNLLLTYYKCLDDWQDEKKAGRRLYAQTLQDSIKALTARYPEKTRILADSLDAIHACEKNGERDLDTVSGHFGSIMAAVFACRRDEWEDTLKEMGFFFGKFIYLMDAYEDLEADRKKGCYNPFLPLEGDPLVGDADFEEKAGRILTMMMADCCRAFERLPILSYTDILRNILYSGVWTRYNLVKEKRSAR